MPVILQSSGGGGGSVEYTEYRVTLALIKWLKNTSQLHTAFIMHAILLLVPCALYLLSRVVQSLLSPLKSIPGPFWARFSNLWYFNRLWNGQFEHENIALHQKHGPIVRLGPSHYSISDAESVKKIYGPGSKFAKSAWYDSWKHPAQWTVFSDRDIKRHCWCLFLKY